VSIWRLPAKVVYLAYIESSSVPPAIASAYLVPGTVVEDLSFFDTFDPSQLASARPTDRRVARAVHTRCFTNSLFVDERAEGVDALPRSGEPDTDPTVTGPYTTRWQGHFGAEIA
jgi:hypothetical protein